VGPRSGLRRIVQLRIQMLILSQRLAKAALSWLNDKLYHFANCHDLLLTFFFFFFWNVLYSFSPSARRSIVSLLILEYYAAFGTPWASYLGILDSWLFLFVNLLIQEFLDSWLRSTSIFITDRGLVRRYQWWRRWLANNAVSADPQLYTAAFFFMEPQPLISVVLTLFSAARCFLGN